MPSLSATSSSSARVSTRGPKIRPSYRLWNGNSTTRFLRHKLAGAASSRHSVARAVKNSWTRGFSVTQRHAIYSTRAACASAVRSTRDLTTSAISRLMKERFSDVEGVRKLGRWARRTHAWWIRLVGMRTFPRLTLVASLLRVGFDGVVVAGPS